MIDFGFSLKTLHASRFDLLRTAVHKFKPDRVACFPFMCFMFKDFEDDHF